MHPNSCLQLCTWSPKRAVVTHGEQILPRSGTTRRTCVRTKASRVGNPVVRSRPDPAGGAVTELSVAERLQQRANNIMDYSPLLLVSALWGSYTPVLRYLYSMDPALTPQVLTAHRTVISAVALLAASAATMGYKAYRNHQQLQQAKQELLQQQLEQQQLQQHWQHRILAALPEWMQSLGRGQQPQSEYSSSTSTSNAAAATASAAAVLAAGLELGVWNFLGTSSQAIGLELSTATKAAFLTQTTAVITPCLAALCGQAVLPAHWVACLVALLGSCCITLDSLLATQPSHQVPVAQPPQQQVAAVAETQDAAPGSSSSVVIVAPPLADVTSSSSAATSSSASLWVSQQQQQEGQQMAAITADRLTSDITSGDGGSSESSSSSSSGVAVTVPAVTCSPTATPPQGVVPAIACAPVAPASSSNSTVTSSGSSSSNSSAEGGAPTEVLNSSSIATEVAGSEAQQQEQEQQEQQEQQQVPFALFAEQEQEGTTSSSSSWSGELYILLACCCYAIATVRLSMVAPGLDPVQLATSKTLTLAVASLCWLLAFQDGGVTTSAAAASVDAVSAAAAAADAVSVKAAVVAALHSAAEKWQLPDAFTHGSGMLLLFYSALGPGALAAVMQAKGQAVTSAAQAQVFYSLTPVMAALLAALFLQGEEMGPLAWLGGSVIVAASVGTALAGHAGSNEDDRTSSTGASSSSSSSGGGEASSSSGGSSLLAGLRQRASSSSSHNAGDSSSSSGGGGGGGLIGGVQRRIGSGSSSRGSSRSGSRTSSPTV